MMKIFHWTLGLLALASLILVTSGSSEHLTPASFICRLLKRQLVTSNPWSSFPIIYEPIHRGRLTIWTGSSSLPNSEFDCYPDGDKDSVVILNFVNFANKLDWTFYDMNRGVTHFGYSVNQNENSLFNVTLNLGQMNSYLKCNSISHLNQINLDDKESVIKSICQDCGPSILPLIDAQVRELLKTKLNESILENLYWNLAQLITNQHFTSPISLDNNLN